MRPTTLVLQLLCVALGVGALWSALVLADRPLWGGIVVGCVFFVAAAMLGADHLSNPGASPGRRLFFKLVAVAAALPILGLAMSGAITAASGGGWGSALASLSQCVVLVLVLVAIVFDTHPTVQRILRRRGMSVSEHRQ